MLGTAGYLAPEQARGEPATPASDRYALAVVAFELLTGRRPFEGDTPTTEAFAHLNADVPSATALDPMLPASVDDVFERALAKDPESRPATAQALVADLRQALAAAQRAEVPAPPIIDPGEPTRRLVRRSRRPRGAFAAVVATGVLAVGFVAAALLVSGDDPGGSSVSREPQGASTTSESTATEASAPEVDGAALNDEGFARLQAGDYAGALPLLRAAVVALNGTNVLTEAYASYNLAFARAATGRCDGVVGLLDRSERIQGETQGDRRASAPVGSALRDRWRGRPGRERITRKGSRPREGQEGERGVGASYAWARSRATSPSSGKPTLDLLGEHHRAVDD